MKKIIVCIATILSVVSVFAIDNTSVNSKIKNVTVFLNGAQINREATFKLNKGMNYISFDSLSPNINANSIQTSGKGDFIILDTKYLVDQPNYNNPQSVIPEHIQLQIDLLKDSIDNISFDLEGLRFRKEVLETEKQLLVGNKSMKSDSLALLKDALSFLREKYNNINTALIATKKEEYKTNKRLAKLNERLTKLNNDVLTKYTNKPLKPNHKVVVTVQSELPSTGKLAINYMVSNASWSPSYDLRANNINEPIALTYKANVYQNTGENWDNVTLKLSTNNPYKSKTKPVLPVWYLNYYNPLNYSRSTTLGGVAQPKYKEDMAKSVAMDDMMDAESSAMYASMTETFSNVEFNLSIPYSINSDGQNHMVAIKEDKLDAKYNYYVVPKMDENAFLVANIKGFEELNLLPAAANIYYDGTYIGQTMINTNVTGDSLAIDMGREERIVAKRKLAKKDEKDQLLGSDKVKSFNYELTLKNNLISTIDLIVEDQIPVTSDKEIKIETTNLGKADFNKESGMLVWKFALAGKSTKKLGFSYNVQYNKDKSLALN
ncbi:MAG: mucoidy inhibitor MuiA family protein [Flavobacteriales bacterium]|nr:mucoidy inhibitor MuiA family protein [Flavobacteriales bacterium]